MSRDEPNVHFHLPDTPRLAERLEGWGVLFTLVAVLGLICGVGFAVSALAPDREPAHPVAAPRCPAPLKGQRVEIVVRNTGDGLVATCRPLIPGGMK